MHETRKQSGEYYIVTFSSFINRTSAIHTACDTTVEYVKSRRAV